MRKTLDKSCQKLYYHCVSKNCARLLAQISVIFCYKINF